MNAYELRLGNWVTEKIETDCGYHYRFRKVTPSIISSAASENEIDFLEPINLSPEILEACGFEGDDSLNAFSNGAWKLKNDGDYKTWLLEYPHIHCFAVRHLHHLQNLYYAICGSELMIDELQLKTGTPQN